MCAGCEALGDGGFPDVLRFGIANGASGHESFGKHLGLSPVLVPVFDVCFEAKLVGITFPDPRWGWLNDQRD